MGFAISLLRGALAWLETCFYTGLALSGLLKLTFSGALLSFAFIAFLASLSYFI